MNNLITTKDIRRERLLEVLREYIESYSTPNWRATQKSFLNLFSGCESNSVKIDESYLTQMKKGTKPVPDYFARDIEIKMGKQRLWMDTPIEKPSTAEHCIAEPKNKYGITHNEVTLRQVPLFSAAQLPNWRNNMEDKTNKTLPCPQICSRDAFAVIVEDDSMSSLTNNPESIHRGHIAFIDPSETYQHGDAVLAILPGVAEGIIRVYIEDAGRKRLVPLNTNGYSSINITELRAKIIGPVIGTYKNRQRR